MEDVQSTTANGALGARFKAGLQSVLSTLGKTGGLSPEKQSGKMLEPNSSLSNGHMLNGVCSSEQREVNSNDAILGESDNDEDMVIGENDDALLDGADTEEDSNSIAESACSDTSNNHPDDTKKSNELVKKGLGLNGLLDIVTPLPTDSCNVSRSSLQSKHLAPNGCSNVQPKEDGCDNVPNDELSSKTEVTPIFKSPPKMPTKTKDSEPVHIPSPDSELKKIPGVIDTKDETPGGSKAADENNVTEQNSEVMIADSNKLEEGVLQNDKSQIQSLKPPEDDSTSLDTEIIDRNITTENTSMEHRLDPASHADKMQMESVAEVSVLDDNQVGEAFGLSKIEKNMKDCDSSTSLTSLNSKSSDNKNVENQITDFQHSMNSDVLLSPEEIRGDKSMEVISPPSLSTDNSIISASPSCNDNSQVTSETDSQLDDGKLSTPHVKRPVKELLNQTATEANGNTSSKSEKRELSSVSAGDDLNFKEPNKSLTDDRSNYVTVDSDEDVDCQPSKRAKLSSESVEPEDRLNKLISHLSTNLDVPSAQTNYQDEMDDEDDGLESIQLKKNGLASFFDAIIKTDVIKEGYHEELSQKHEELQIRNNMDCKKIQKILHEVKTVREKLKQMNIRPAQRSVSTQICAEKLQVPADQPGNKIIESTVRSHKALAEQKEAVEAKRQLAATAKARNDWQLKQQAEANAIRLAEQAARQRNEEIAKMAANRAKESEKAKPGAVSLMKSAGKPMSATPKTSTSASSEVIDLTAEEDSTNSPESAPAVGYKASPMVPKAHPMGPKAPAAAPRLPALTPRPPLAAPNTNGKSPALLPTKSTPKVATAAAVTHTAAAATHTATASPTAPLHPAPLPACPLTGHSGHLLKPNAPRLDLSTKEDGIVLQWNMSLTKGHAKIATYQIFGYKERPGSLTGLEWKKVGDLKALPLPMACTLTQFQTGHTYHFAVRAVDELGRTGPFGAPKSTKLG